MDTVDFGSSDTPVGDSSPHNGEVEEYSLASPFLNGMPEEHRQLLSPYVKKWDGEVTKKFQNYASQLKPYQALGSVEDLQKYSNFVNNFRNDPEGLFRLMWQGMEQQYGDKFQEELSRILEIQEQQQMSDDYYQENGQGEYQPDPNEQFQQGVMKELNDLREWRANFEKSQEEAVQQQQLDTVLEQMHNAFGDFNDDFIVLELSRHGDVQKAMQAWNNLIGKYSSQQQAPAQRQAPKIMGGQGGVPSGQVDTSKLRASDRRQAVQNMLSQLEG